MADLLARTDVRHPERAARTMVMLRDGATVGGYFEDAAATRATLIKVFDAVLLSQS